MSLHYVDVSRVVLVLDPPKENAGIRGPVEVYDEDGEYLGMGEIDHQGGGIATTSLFVGGVQLVCAYKLKDIEGLDANHYNLLGLTKKELKQFLA